MYGRVSVPKWDLLIQLLLLRHTSTLPRPAPPTPNAPASSAPTASTSPSRAHFPASGWTRTSPATPPPPNAIPSALQPRKSVATPPKSLLSNLPSAQTPECPVPARMPPQTVRCFRSPGKTAWPLPCLSPNRPQILRLLPAVATSVSPTAPPPPLPAANTPG